MTRRHIIDREYRKFDDDDNVRVTPHAGGNSLWKLEVSKGNVPGHSEVFLSATVEEVTDTQQTLWEGPTLLYDFDITPGTVAITSTDATDDAAGTGCQEVILIGLDSTRENEIVEFVETGGIAGNSGTLDFSRINSALTWRKGSSSAGNAGTITTTVNSKVLGVFLPGENRDRKGVYSTPSGTTYYNMKFSVTSRDEDEVEWEFLSSFQPSEVPVLFSKGWVGGSIIDFTNAFPGSIPSPTDFEVRVKKLGGAGNARISLVTEILVVDDEFN